MLNDKCKMKVFPSEMILNFVLIGFTQLPDKLEFVHLTGSAYGRRNAAHCKERIATPVHALVRNDIPLQRNAAIE
mgnify:CR=1 FL=1